MGKISNLNKILFINFGGIGDEVLFLPTINDFKEEYPECKVTLLLEPRSAGVAKLTDKIDSVITFDVKNSNKIISFIKLLALIKDGRFDAVISSGSNKLICLLLYLSGTRVRVGYYTGALSKLLLTGTVVLNKDQYSANMYHDLLHGIGIYKNTPLPQINLSNQALDFASKVLSSKQPKPIITVHPGVSSLSVQKNIIKSWPTESWAELICKLLVTNKYLIALTGGPDDEETILHIRKELEKNNFDKNNLIDLYGVTKNLTDLAAVIKLSKLLICVDSAPMHMAVGLGSELLAIFGPTDDKKLLPIDDKFTVAVNSNINCRPCLWDTRNQVCNKQECLNLSVDSLFELVNSKMDKVKE